MPGNKKIVNSDTAPPEQEGGRQELVAVGTELGRYWLLAEIGEGGMATVFKARDKQLGRIVAIKVMFPHLAKRKEAVARFQREARAAAGLDLDEVVRVYDVGGGELVGGKRWPPYIVLEYIDGQSLDVFFKEQSPPLAEVVAAMGVALCQALKVAHQNKIIHRDIKPANVMVTSAGRLALADFGVAHLVDGDSIVTQTGAILGTPAFMSPEQACGEDIDVRSDLYSLGATLFAIASGENPYQGNAAQVMHAIAASQRSTLHKIVPQVGREFSRLIESLMHKEPAKRPDSAAMVLEVLEAFVRDGGFSDSKALLVEYLCEPTSLDLEADNRRTLVAATLNRAQELGIQGRNPKALALVERVLCLEPDNLRAETLAFKFSKQGQKRLWPMVVAPMVVAAGMGAIFWGSRPGSIAEYVESPLAVSLKEKPGQIEDASSAPAKQFDAGTIAKGSHGAKGKGPVLSSDKSSDMPEEDRKKDRVVMATDTTPRKAKEHLGVTEKLAEEEFAVLEQASSAKKSIPDEDTQASLIVDIKPWCNVWIDSVQRGRASGEKTYSVKAGPHRVECKQPGTGLIWKKELVLKAGEQKRLEGSVLGEVTIAVQLKKGDSVAIGKYKISNGTSLRMPAGRYRIEVFSKGALTSPIQYLNLRMDCILKDLPSLSCSR